jgi:hypothetical protein
MGTREKWLLSVLSGIFIIQAGVLIYGVRVCTKTVQGEMPNSSVTQVCPQIGERFDLTFGTMIATTLALLTGSTLAAAQEKSKPKPPTYTPPPPGRQ